MLGDRFNIGMVKREILTGLRGCRGVAAMLCSAHRAAFLFVIHCSELSAEQEEEGRGEYRRVFIDCNGESEKMDSEGGRSRREVAVAADLVQW